MSEQTKTRPDWTRREQCPLCKWWVASNLIQFHVCQSAGETPAPQEINKLQLEAENTRLRAALEAARERAIHAAGQVVARHPDHARVECLSICRIVDAALKGDPTVAASPQQPVGLVCPFCGDDDFDAVGLKLHLTTYCEAYASVEVGNRVY